MAADGAEMIQSGSAAHANEYGAAPPVAVTVVVLVETLAGRLRATEP